jgi:hypothetical protein
VDKRTKNQGLNLKHGACAGLLLCLVSGASLAQDSGVSAARLISDDPDTVQPSGFSPWPLFQNQAAGLAFDVAGSDTRKLELQLSEPLSLQATTRSRWLNAGGGSLLAGTSLEWMTTGNLSFGTGFQESRTNVQFQPVGSIHCQNGILQADSYRASDCYFVNESNDLNMGIITIGADYEISNDAMAAINLFRQEATIDMRGPRLQGSPAISPVLDAGLLGPTISNPVLPRFSTGEGLEYLASEVTGIDLEFKLGVSTDTAGDMQLGLQFTHVLDGSYLGIYPSQDSFTHWNLAKPFDSARVSFDWQKNSFSGGVQGFYREPVDFLNRSGLDSVTTFDVYFTWRAPWNASLSVGASNLLNSGVDESANSENTNTDPFEAVYGRIPYVRYQQDL